MADDKYFDLEVITPDRVFWQGKAFMLELNTSEGEAVSYTHLDVYKRQRWKSTEQWIIQLL